nr:13919_t:CDS:2 [Entrophospora candida]
MGELSSHNLQNYQQSAGTFHNQLPQPLQQQELIHPLLYINDQLNDQLINVKEEESLSLFKPGKHCKPRHPPSHRKSHRAYALFTNPPDVIKGALLFWETLENGTFIVGQFSEGFLKGEEEDYTFKIYQSSNEIFDLKPKNESFDKIFKVRSNNSTDSFLFNVNETLITSGDIVGSDLVIGKPGALLGKSKIHSLPL